MFNLGFLYSYPKSPYWNQDKGLQYFDELAKKHPKSAWAFQARAWSDIMRAGIALDKKRQSLKKELKSKDQALEKELKSKDEAIEKELKSKDDAITTLQEQIKRSREIDMEVERRERELLK